ncbi:hypothetical protein [Weissella halotolerans]|uniref:Uncharacterized protein n=1 Tax=Weissella halotolerans DSM 20190 TaxID=1123500 RepID=A0A0R2FYL3_9LACO|nr:hypothetical protein [Weissella halotolerans]KRN33523.1 hypothetical protein IV68_GL000327 [Weissella halotolerans DSM 20190]
MQYTHIIKSFNKFSILALLASSIAVPASGVVIAHADEVESPAKVVQTASDTQLQTAKTFLTQYAGFNDYDYAQMTNQEVIDLYNSAQKPTTEFVGGTTVAKAVLRVWKKLPASVRRKIGQYTGLSGLLKAIDHFTGTEYHIIYSALRRVGLSPRDADWVTKAITLFI